MLAQIVTTAIASFFVNAVAGVNAAILMNRSGKPQPSESAAGSVQAPERSVKVQLWVAKGAPVASALSSADCQTDAAHHVHDPIELQIKTHREAIALYEGKAIGSDVQLRVFAQDILPHLQQHLAMLESLQENRHARR